MCADSQRPVLSAATVPLTREISVTDERGRCSLISIPAERPLTVYVDKRELVTLMTMGGNPEALVLGYLRNQRLVRCLADIAAVQVDWEVGAAAVQTRGGIEEIEQRTAQRIVTTGCGQGTVFGGLMDEVDQIVLPPTARLAQSALYRIIDSIRSQQSIYKKAGSVHGCALFSNQGELLYFVEDVGRHNAVDAIAGKMWLDGINGADKVFYSTGRLTSEMVIKGAQMGIPILLSRSGSTEMGHQVADAIGMSLFSRCSGRHFLLLTHPHRLEFEPALFAQDEHGSLERTPG
ncbi:MULTISPECIES: formate dehydrogenase accessory sulfurtransferase FdhD [unclassified Undibacterium]|uniref:formate dehydrogenase accessory sulfurtransferase FdhD n=1 Tax=unclassified Undibacterium TaxID=2630295 RepID=UPI002AC9AF55|nr:MULTISPECIES: formate dehydrogenase accessory sulfurtransferase FdhD [unclassified Undibacterium]MEB0141036.1 formate dehydrogenase accessory sulfurtransferase FdhD [Undibacterium sp. CCC2.1]MEB0174008.1 formate dehydrogenase accessory sulfurtransferase FdhD [Undibacterium sp. CCC1.1]MEB0177964.1 formate dehydrogenase accessory sulfurtransferase FdhD [Undibacterium sp. CCC3.4]MEB0217212.1 formate dehydrogenase accessory sulfurtransferase FdhD [Undibacterium sp. 5I2]WPX42188.1 formate dehydr